MEQEILPAPEKKKHGGRRREKNLGKPRTGDGITHEQEGFCRALALGMSIKEAISFGGCSVHPETAKAWLRNIPKVAQRVEELKEIATQNAISKTGVNRTYVIEHLMKVVERCMQAEPVKDRQGNVTGEYKFDASGANAALRMLGDTLGMFKPVETKPGDEYANLSDDDIARIAQELATQTGLLEAAPRIEAPQRSQQIIDVQAIS